MAPKEELRNKIGLAVAHFWKTRKEQAETQKKKGKKDQGKRGAATGGAQLDGFIDLIAELIIAAGATDAMISRKKSLLHLPGYFRATKQWDLLVVSGSRLIAVIEAKSHIGPSFGNNFNNRTEEAMGSALDLWTAYREGAFSASSQPWLGYLLLLEDCPASSNSVKRVYEPHFQMFPEFRDSSYAKRYELFCQKLLRERHYHAASLLLSSEEGGLHGSFSEPNEGLSFELFARSLQAHIGAYAKK